MAHVRNCQRENNNPKLILSEDIFQLVQRDPMRGTQIFFRNNLTNINKRIYMNWGTTKKNISSTGLKKGESRFSKRKTHSQLKSHLQDNLNKQYLNFCN